MADQNVVRLLQIVGFYLVEHLSNFGTQKGDSVLSLFMHMVHEAQDSGACTCAQDILYHVIKDRQHKGMMVRSV